MAEEWTGKEGCRERGQEKGDRKKGTDLFSGYGK
jgi:hypothetical protein